MKKPKNSFKFILPAMILCLLLCGMDYQDNTDKNTFEDFKNARIGAQTGTSEDFSVHETFPDAEVINFVSVADEAIALDTGKVDAFAVNYVVGKKIIEEYPEFYVVDEPLLFEEFGFAFDKTPEGAVLRDEINAFLDNITEDGTLESMNKHWLQDWDDESLIADPSLMTGEKGTVKVALELLYEPFAYIKDGLPCGFEVDILTLFGIASGYKVEFVDMNFDSVMSSITTGNCDIGASGITITEEHKESVYYSKPYYSAKSVLIAKGEGAVTEKKNGFLDSFDKTFIRENRWKMLLSGIATTLIITVAAVILGSLLGFILCMQKLRNKVCARIVDIYIKVFQGTPVVIALMVFYYVIFGRLSTPAVIVAIITFMFNFSAYACEIIRTGIEAVDPGQREAALALGFSEREAFTYYIFPQAAEHFLPVYKGEVISLLKNTSVVGYITIVDLTRAGDLIRSRTYEAFFPLVTAALIYFILSFLLGRIIGIFKGKVTPNRKNRQIKGVNQHD